MNIKTKIKDTINKVVSFFHKNYIYKKLHEIILNIFIAKPDEYFSYDEPSSKKMKNKTYWIQIADEEE